MSTSVRSTALINTNLAVVVLLLLLGSVFVVDAVIPPDAYTSIVSNDYNVPYYALQELPIPTGMISSSTRYGCGVSIAGNKDMIGVVGLDTSKMRQFAAFFRRNPSTGKYITPKSVFYGDAINTDDQYYTPFIDTTGSSYSFGTSCPVCLSEDASYFAFGGWMTTGAQFQSSNTSVITLRRNSAGEYVFNSKLYSSVSNVMPNVRLFAFDMVCSSQMDYIKISERSIDSNDGISVLTTFNVTSTSGPHKFNINIGNNNNNDFKAPQRTYGIANSIIYPSGIAADSAFMKMSMSGDNQYYLIKQDGYNIDMRYTVNDSIAEFINLANVTDSRELTTIALNYDGSILTFASRGTVFDGEMYIQNVVKKVFVINSTLSVTKFDTNDALYLIDPSAPNQYITWGVGASLSYAPNKDMDILVAGMPGYPVKPTLSLSLLQTGGLSVWKRCQSISILTNSYIPGSYKWLPGQNFFTQFSPGIPTADGLGASFTSHNVYSSDGSVLVASSPMTTDDYTSSYGSGRVFVFIETVPTCSGLLEVPGMPGINIWMLVTLICICLGLLLMLCICFSSIKIK